MAYADFSRQSTATPAPKQTAAGTLYRTTTTTSRYFRGQPFDLRVSVQRGAMGQWQVTGIVAKVASKRCFLTNVAQGGTVYRLEPILIAEYPHLQPKAVIKGIEQFSLQVAEHLGNHLPHMADLGLDVGITIEGFPMLIECNGKDQRYSFREAGMLQEWKATYDNPMAYARYLLDCSSAKAKEELQKTSQPARCLEAIEVRSPSC